MLSDKIPMMKLILVRHGETEENSSGILQGLLPGKLSEAGKQQVKNLSNELKDKKVDLVFCSPVDRCKETLNIILQETGWQKPVIYSEKIKERDFGNFSGRPHSEINFDELDIDNEENRKARVETLESVNNRVKEFLKDIKENYPDKTIMVVSHSNPLRWFYANILGKSFKEVLETIKIKNATTVEFEI
jgi:broad specificity phosphatase PhoE